jgi:cyclase
MMPEPISELPGRSQFSTNDYTGDVVPRRIIARLDVKNGRVVKGIMMEGVQPVGDPVEMSRAYYEQGADELVLLDIVASLYRRLELPDIIAEIVKDVFAPVCAGGGVRSCQDAEKLLYSGADKVCVNTAAMLNPDLISELSGEFGAQSVVLQLDARRLHGTFRVLYHTGRDLSDVDAAEWLRIAQDKGIGEVLLTSVEKDGTGRGPDLDLIDFVGANVHVPIIYGGGIGSVDHIDRVFSRGFASGVVLANYLHNERQDIADIKSSLARAGHLIREDYRA